MCVCICLFKYLLPPWSINNTISKSRMFLISLVYVCIYLFMYVCHASWPNEKRYRLEIWYTHSPRPYLKTAFFKWPRGPLANFTELSSDLHRISTHPAFLSYTISTKIETNMHPNEKMLTHYFQIKHHNPKLIRNIKN